MNNHLKDVITDNQLDKLNEQDIQTVLKDYEVTRSETGETIYIKKSVFYGNPEDIATDKTCDLSFLEGAIIKKTGFHAKACEGGLTIVYEKNGEDNILVLGFTELGMWIYANTSRESTPL